MQRQNAQAWTLPRVGEQPEFGTTVIPNHPGYPMAKPRWSSTARAARRHFRSTPKADIRFQRNI